MKKIVFFCIFALFTSSNFAAEINSNKIKFVAEEVGIASYYGKEFHGKKTASGEIYNYNLYTAASLSLPLKSYAKVTNLSNNKSIIVKINDRGPYAGRRIIDLSKAAAKSLGFIHKGTTKVKVELIDNKHYAELKQKGIIKNQIKDF